MADPVPFTLDPSIIAAFPQVEVHALRVRLADQGDLAPLVPPVMAECAEAAAALADVDPITELEAIARWRRAYGALGVKPSKFHSSIEALLRRAKKGQMAATGLPAVDLYNAVSVICRAPLGAYDVEKLSDAPLTLRRAVPEADRFQPLGGAPEAFPLSSGLAVYAQGAEVLCWGFNTRDSAVSAVDESSRDIVFFSETAEQAGAAAADAALERLRAEIAPVGFAGEIVRFSAASPNGEITLD